MKKYFIIFLLCFSTISVKAHALLPIGGYFGIRGSEYIGTHSDNKRGNSLSINDSSFSSSIAAGIKLLDFRFELEYMYRLDGGKIYTGNHTKKYDMDLKMFNIYYNVFEFLFLKFYINGGIGKYDVKTSLIHGDNSKVWNVGLGATFSLLDIINVDAGMRHVDLGKMKFKNQSSRQNFEEIYAGIRLGF